MLFDINIFYICNVLEFRVYKGIGIIKLNYYDINIL